MFFLSIKQDNIMPSHQIHEYLYSFIFYSSTQDPFLGIPAEYQQALRENETKLLINFVTKSSVDVWLLEMHEFLLLNLKSQRATNTYKPSWR